ncbi:MAG: YraN family protein [Polyangiaceae bacterium]|nr:YraN family protein [Polyangiaceae bacterium]
MQRRRFRHGRRHLTLPRDEPFPLFTSDKRPPRTRERSTSSVDRAAPAASKRIDPSTTTRTRQESGARAEDAAANYFELIGYSILARNLRVGRAEIDLLVRDDDVIVVVEVRTRGPGSYQRPLDSITPAKRRRLRAAGESLWRKRFLKDQQISRMRFDAVGVTFDENDKPIVEHIRAAF